MPIKILSPIVFFVYNRPAHTMHALEALAANHLAESSILYIYADGPKQNADKETLYKIQQTRDVIKQKQWCQIVNIIESDKNIGLANSVINGVTDVINKHDRVIVLEDDLIVSPYFLDYMNDSLVRYEHDMRVGQIGACNFFANGDNYPKQFFIPIPDCWGWAVWKNRWDHFNPDAQELLSLLRQDVKQMSVFNAYNSYNFEDMLQRQIEGKVDCWDIRWQAVCVLNNWLILYPNNSMTNHIQSNEAIHTKINILPPLQLQEPGLQTIEVTTLPDVIKAMKLGYAGKGDYFGKEIPESLSKLTLAIKLKNLIKKFLPSFFINSLKKYKYFSLL